MIKNVNSLLTYITISINLQLMHREKRAHQRFHSEVEARLFFGNMFYKSQVTNLSEGGLFVRTRVNFPIDSVFVTVILLNQHTLNILSRVKRAIKPQNHGTPRNNFGMGLELINPAEDYTAYVRSYQTSEGRPVQ